MTGRLFALCTAAITLCLGFSTSASAVDISACPFVITGAGNYRVVKDLSAASGPCITITPAAFGASITVKLNGFTIRGASPSSGAGIIAGIASSTISIVGPGTITNFGAGIALPFTEDAVVKRVIVSRTSLGIVVSQGEVSDSMVTGSLGGGVTVGDKSLVKNVIAADNDGTGIEVGTGSTVSQSTANDNGAGVLAGDKSLVKNTTANDNATFGIRIGARGNVQQSTANNNKEAGIIASVRSNVNKNTANNNAIGIEANCPATVQQNAALGNLTEDILLRGNGCALKNNVTSP
jgi:hypothetical protein